ncbi:hypothetical protein CKAH01_13036 [Colletotrichum kahawae]|uniref:Uncharacterized protein n=1 Tax=Colletotrichum kahawae TaxID=34407 RepID=A0AAD9YSQ3_COLKA|nr:hypothetical protein CKAH01_13036 [Colletotrichum kahawae]
MKASDIAAKFFGSWLAAFGRRIRPVRSPAAQQRSFRVRNPETKAAGKALSSVIASSSVALDHGPDKQVGRRLESATHVWLDHNSRFLECRPPPRSQVSSELDEMNEQHEWGVEGQWSD